MRRAVRNENIEIGRTGYNVEHDLFSKDTAMAKAPYPEYIEKEYPYRYRWFQVFLMIFLGFACTIGSIWEALSGIAKWIWLFTPIFILMFLGGAAIAVANLLGKNRLIITKDSIYLPSVWKSDTYLIIPFADISRVEFMEYQGNKFLRLFVGKKEYPITNTWLPTEAFQEIADLVAERSPVGKQKNGG
jgi:hypothetical protein